MDNFEYVVPTRLIVGKEKENQVGQIIKEYGFTNVLVVYGQKSVKASGLLDRVINSLRESEINYVLLGGVEPNPKLSYVIDGVKIARENQVELVLAIGGGSVIDAAKSICAGYYYEGNPYDFNDKKVVLKKSLPIATILTIAAAGSEMSTSCVISDASRNQKKGFNSELNRPLFSILNPELTYTVNKYQTACGIVDIMMHTLERYFNPSLNIEFADEIAIGLLKAVKKAGEVVINDLTNYEARRSLMLAGAFSHNGLTGIGKNVPMPVHQLEHALSGYYDFVAHGAGLAVLFPKWSMLYYKSDVKKFSYFAKEVMGVKEEDECKAAYLGIVAIQSFFKELGMPATFKDLGIENPNIDKLLDILFDGREHIESLGRKIDRKEAEKIYLYCLKEDF